MLDVGEVGFGDALQVVLDGTHHQAAHQGLDALAGHVHLLEGLFLQTIQDQLIGDGPADPEHGEDAERNAQ